jgi:hypothetical protein|nr:MAG TPA: hypothetical protein [Caudoviricetes sp.]
MKLQKNIIGIVKTTVVAYLFIMLLVVMLALVWLGYVQRITGLVAILLLIVVGGGTVIVLSFKQLVKFIEDMKEL